MSKIEYPENNVYYIVLDNDVVIMWGCITPEQVLETLKEVITFESEELMLNKLTELGVEIEEEEDM